VTSSENRQSYKIWPVPGDRASVFVDHSGPRRSGHAGHAMFQNHKNEIFAFYANCSGEHNGGHCALGWMECKKSSDGGRSWTAGEPVPESKAAFDGRSGYAMIAEKAVFTQRGTALLFYMISDISQGPGWEPYLVPRFARSSDGGLTWSESRNLGLERGRVFDAKVIGENVYVLKFCNDAEVDYCGNDIKHRYTLFITKDDINFTEISVLPFDTRERCYGTIGQLKDGSLIVYIYNRQNEYKLDYCISRDGGLTWDGPQVAYFEKRIRNPQLVQLGGQYFLHGRSGSHGDEDMRGHFIIYHSSDGVNWDPGTIVVRRTHGLGAYSNSVAIHDPISGNRRIRVQASHAYHEQSTNILTWWIDVQIQ
jgi:hypothetical protein